MITIHCVQRINITSRRQAHPVVILYQYIYMYLYIFGCYKCSVTLLSRHLHHMQIEEHCKNSIGLTF